MTDSHDAEQEAPVTGGPLPRLEVEFTVEPFHDDAPGPHVAGAIEAVERTIDGAEGATIDVGPFGTTVRASGSDALRALAAALDAALRNGASRISVQVTADAGEDYPHSA